MSTAAPQPRTRPSGTAALGRAPRAAQAGAAHPGVVHAPGRPLAAGVPQGPRGRRDARVLPRPRPGHRDHPAAGAPPRRRRGDLLLRHRACRSRRSASTSTSCPASARSSPQPVRTPRRPRPAARPRRPSTSPTSPSRCAARRASSAPRRSSASPARRSPSRPTSSRAARPRNHEHTKALMYGDPRAVGRPVRPARADLRRRSCGSRSRPAPRAVQLFDSWAGALPPADYAAFVLPHSAAALAAVADLGVPAHPLRRRHRRAARR